MNFLFTITAHGFDKAAALEKSLKNLGIPYEVVQKKGIGTAPAKRKRLTKSEVAAILVTISNNPDWDDVTVAKQSGCARNTVNRIRRGLHPLCDKVNVSSIKKAVKK